MQSCSFLLVIQVFYVIEKFLKTTDYMIDIPSFLTLDQQFIQAVKNINYSTDRLTHL